MCEANVRDIVKVDLDGPKPRELAVRLTHRPLTTGMPKHNFIELVQQKWIKLFGQPQRRRTSTRQRRDEHLETHKVLEEPGHCTTEASFLRTRAKVVEAMVIDEKQLDAAGAETGAEPAKGKKRKLMLGGKLPPADAAPSLMSEARKLQLKSLEWAEDEQHPETLVNQGHEDFEGMLPRKKRKSEFEDAPRWGGSGENIDKPSGKSEPSGVSGSKPCGDEQPSSSSKLDAPGRTVEARFFFQHEDDTGPFKDSKKILSEKIRWLDNFKVIQAPTDFIDKILSFTGRIRVQEHFAFTSQFADSQIAPGSPAALPHILARVLGTYLISAGGDALCFKSMYKKHLNVHVGQDLHAVDPQLYKALRHLCESPRTSWKLLDKWKDAKEAYKKRQTRPRSRPWTKVVAILHDPESHPKTAKKLPKLIVSFREFLKRMEEVDRCGQFPVFS